MSAATTLAAYETQRDALLAQINAPTEYRTGRRSVERQDLDKKLAEVEKQIDKYSRQAARESSPPMHLARIGRAT